MMIPHLNPFLQSSEASYERRVNLHALTNKLGPPMASTGNCFCTIGC